MCRGKSGVCTGERGEVLRGEEGQAAAKENAESAEGAEVSQRKSRQGAFLFSYER